MGMSPGNIVDETRDVRLGWSTGLANWFDVGFVVVNSFKRVEPKPLDSMEPTSALLEVVFHVEFDGVYLIEETFLEASVFEHLAVGRGFFFVNDPLD